MFVQFLEISVQQLYDSIYKTVATKGSRICLQIVQAINKRTKQKFKILSLKHQNIAFKPLLSACTVNCQ